jgi:phospholipase/carboxylesterase
MPGSRVRKSLLLVLLPGLCLGCAHAPQEHGAGSAAPAALAYEDYTLGGDEPGALLVALHYSGSSPAFWKELLQGWETPTRVVLPRGPRPHREGFTWFPADHEQKTAVDKAADVERMAERIAQLVREVRAAHPGIRRVAVTGFSYGGDLAWVLALRHPELFDAAVPMGSRLLGEPEAGGPPASRVWVLQGGADPIVPAQHTVERVAALKAAGVPIDVRVYPGLGHDFSPQLVADWRAFLQQQLAAPR